MTFDSKASAQRWLALTEADMMRGTWTDPHAKSEDLRTYATRWITERPGLSERTKRYYAGLLRLHIVPTLGAKDLKRITPAAVRSWRQGLLDSGLGASTVAKSYRLLRAVMNTAVDDEVIDRNPCRIKGAGVENAPERPVLTVAQVYDLADAITPRYRAFVFLAVFASLRWGELMGLRRSDIDLNAGLVRVERAVSELGSRQVIKEPKTAAGRRVVAIPEAIVPEIRKHFENYAEPGAGGRVFIGPKGATPLRAGFSKSWAEALEGAGLIGIHVHDLRHTGNHLAALTGATTRELMGRMGHASMQAALIYQHRTADRDRAIAEGMDRMLEETQGHAEGTDPN